MKPPTGTGSSDAVEMTTLEEEGDVITQTEMPPPDSNKNVTSFINMDNRHELDKLINDKYKLKVRTSMKSTLQGRVYNFLERPTGWKCFVYHFTV